MPALSVHLGDDARGALCRAFDRAHASIDAEFFSISDPDVVASLNRAAARGVSVHLVVEGDTHRYGRAREPSDSRLCAGLDATIDVVVSRRPHGLVHGKAAVVDDSVALIATANATRSGFRSPGEALVIDRCSADAAQVRREIRAAHDGIDGKSHLRAALDDLFRSPRDLRIASEDLSDPHVAAWLLHRAKAGRHDRVLIGRHPSKAAKSVLARLERSGVAVRVYPAGYMHEKYVDDGTHIYLGSANLTRNGLEESHEVGVVAGIEDFDDGDVRMLRADFDTMWSRAARL